LRELSDEEMSTALRAALFFDPRVLGSRPQVSVEDGVAVLTGTVCSVAARDAAEETAENTVGIHRVWSYLRVRPDDEVDDGDLETRIGQALSWNPYVRRHDIEVVARAGYVSLYGSVDSRFERAEARRVAASVAGVVDVDARLALRQGDAPPEDWLIRENIESFLRWDPWVDASNVTVTVLDGVATLFGTVRDWRAARAAVQSAWEGGARRVLSRLEVRDTGPGPLATR
jgi:osmotically-inducible protein OsmY